MRRAFLLVIACALALTGGVARLRADRIPSSQAVVRRNWKYIEWPEFDYRQLFDLKNDPGELRNLAAESAHADERFRMQAALTAWRALVQ